MWYVKTKLLVCLLIWSWCLLAQAQLLPGSPEDIIPCSNPQVCGCNDATSCLDCKGVPYGTASKLPCAGPGCGMELLPCGSCFSCPNNCPTVRCRKVRTDGEKGWPMSQEVWQTGKCPAGTLDDGSNTFNHGDVFYTVQLSAKDKADCYVDPNNTREQPVEAPFCWDTDKSGSLLTASPGTELITAAEAATAVQCGCNNGDISCGPPSPPIPGCFTLDFLNAGGNKWQSEYILSGFKSSNTTHACGIELVKQLANFLPPPSAQYAENLAYVDWAYSTNNKEYIFSGNYTGYYLPGKDSNNSEKLMGIMWLLMLQKTPGVCADKTFPPGNTYSLVDEVQSNGIWQKLTTPLYVQTPLPTQRLKEPSNLRNYYMYQEWFTCMREYAEKNYEKNKNFITCSWWGNIFGHDDNVGFGGNGLGGIRDETRYNGCNRGSLVMAKDGCSMISKDQVTNKCGPSAENIKFYGYSDTPISLLLDSSYDIHNNISIVEFPLSERVSTRFWTWKGSSKAPLLVYDPAHTGTIESAKQLFGPSTFGGVGNQAQFKPISFSGDAPRYWKHGFEALGSLDANRDGKIAGEELRPLALWFDADQDAVSDAREVKTLEEVGVTELFYTPDSIDHKNSSIEVAHGFTRVVNGVRTSGRAIDWGAEGSDSQLDLMKKHVEFSPPAQSGLGLDRASDVIVETSAKEAGEEAKKPSDKKELPGSDGLWSWSLNSTDETNGRTGYFALTTRNGEVSGNTFSELMFGHQEGTYIEPLEMLQFNSFKGKQNFDESGSSTLTFSVSVKDGVIENTAEMSKDGLTMTGSSVATLENKKGTKVVRYSWKAKKLGESNT